MKLEPSLLYGDNVLLCIVDAGEDTSESAITPQLTALGYKGWGVAETAGVEEAIKACEQEGAKTIVLCPPFGWNPGSSVEPDSYTLFIK